MNGPEEVGVELLDPLIDRTPFLWNQQRYLLENIRLADTKAGFILTISAAVLSASLSPASRFSFSLSRMSSAQSYVGTGFFVAGLCALVASTLLSAWSIKPRLRTSAKPSPVSWVNVARYNDVDSFRDVNRGLTKGMAADLLCEQVYWMSRICVQKHHLIATSITLALVGGFLVVVAVLLG